MESNSAGIRFNESLEGQTKHPCLILDRHENEILNSECEADIAASTDQYASYLKLRMQAKSESSDSPDAAPAVIYIYCNNFISYQLHENTTRVGPSNEEEARSPEIKSYILELKVNVEDLANEHFAVSIPSFALAFREKLFSEGNIRILLHATFNVVNAMQDVSSVFDKEKIHPPWYRFHDSRIINRNSGKASFELNDLLDLSQKASNIPKAYPPQSTFPSFFHYATIQALGSKAEQDYREEKIIEFEKEEHDLYLVDTPKAHGDLLGVMYFPDNAKIRLRTGDEIKITLIRSPCVSHVPVTAKVLAPGCSLPREAISLAIVWPKYDDNTFYKKEGLPIITQQDMDKSRTNLPNLLRSSLDHKKTVVKIDLCQRDHELRLNLNGLCKLHDLQGADVCKCPLLAKWRKVLCASRLDLVGSADVFSDLRAMFPSPEAHVNLNHSQKEAIRNGNYAIGGILNVHGPPGTGKTTLIRECAKLYFRLDEIKQVLVLSPTNLNVDALARNIHNDLRQLQEQEQAKKSRYVVRLHSVEAEMSTFLQRVNDARDGGRQKRPNMDNVPVSLVAESERTTLELLSHSKSYKEKSIRDGRVQQIHLSVGGMMLRKIGRNHVGRLENKTLRPEINQLYEKALAKQNGKFSSSALSELMEAASSLYKEVLKGAAAIVATVSRACLPSMHTTPKIVFIDESSHVDEASMWSVMTLPNLGGMVLVGDPYQLRNLVTSPTSINPFAEQKKMTFPERLLAVGFPTHLLDTQMRMIPQLIEPSADIIYQGRLKNGPGTDVLERRLAQDLLAYNEQKWGKRSSLIYIDVRKSEAALTIRMERNGSRQNHFFLSLAFNEIEILLKRFPGASIALATPYSEDRQRALSYLAEMRDNKHEFSKLERFSVISWDTSQGLEFDIGFVMLPLIPRKGSIVHEMGRVNVISTRWRCGMYLVGTDESVSGSIPGGLQVVDWLAKYRVRYWLKNRVSYANTASLPPCRWRVESS